jgi:hypothetical protein
MPMLIADRHNYYLCWICLKKSVASVDYVGEPYFAGIGIAVIGHQILSLAIFLGNQADIDKTDAMVELPTQIIVLTS